MKGMLKYVKISKNFNNRFGMSVLFCLIFCCFFLFVNFVVIFLLGVFDCCIKFVFFV